MKNDLRIVLSEITLNYEVCGLSIALFIVTNMLTDGNTANLRNFHNEFILDGAIITRDLWEASVQTISGYTLLVKSNIGPPSTRRPRVHLHDDPRAP